MPENEPNRTISSTVGLVAVIALIIVVSAFLKTDDPGSAHPSAPAPPGLAPVQASPVRPEPPPPHREAPLPLPIEELEEMLDPVEAADSPLGDLGRRALRDVTRFEPSRDGFTVQLLVACQAETVEGVLARSGGAEELYVLPATLDGRSCFRVCWGSFSSRAEAESDPGIPAPVREGLGPSKVRPVAEILP